MASLPPLNTAGNPYWNGKRFSYDLKATGAGSADARSKFGGGWNFGKGEGDAGMGGAKDVDGVWVTLRNAKSFEPNLQPGSYTAFQDVFARRNQMLADGLARKAAEILERQVLTGSRARGKRGSVSTGRLKRVVLNPQNRHSDKHGFAVGSPLFMDRSEAKYWRAIEQGTSHFVGKRIYGIWGGTLTGMRGGGGQFGPYPIAGFPLSGFGKAGNGRLRPMGRKRAYSLLRRSYGMNPASATALIGMGWGTIKHPIQSHRYFHQAWEEFGTKQKAREALRDAAREVGIQLKI